MIRLALALAGAPALAGCATDRVTLLDGESGQPGGAVAVLSADGSETVVDSPNSQALLKSGGPRVRAVDRLDPSYAALIGTLPPAATRFQMTFPIGEARILAGQRTVLEQIRAELDRRPGAQIEVAGFTDSTGDEASNDTLSKQRAEAVARELRELGFPVDPEDAVGRGEDDARAALGDNVSDESYRRVLVIVR